MSVGELSSFIYLFSLLVFPLRIIGYLFSEIPHSVAGWRRINEVLDEKLLRDPANDIQTAQRGAGIEIKDCFFEHQGQIPIINNLNLKISEGKTVALVGATGCGKTTLLHLISGLISPTSGNIAVQSGGVSLVFQEAFLFAETLRYNITLDAEISTESVKKALEISQCNDFIGDLELGIDTSMGERGISLSGGQRQRVALARAIAQNRSVLLLDDTTSALDPNTEANVVRSLRQMSGHHTVVIVASRPSTIALADEVLYMDDGCIADRGSHEELLGRSAKYLELIKAFEHDRKSTDTAATHE